MSIAMTKGATSPDFNPSQGNKKRNAVTPYSLEDLQDNDNLHDIETGNQQSHSANN